MRVTRCDSNSLIHASRKGSMLTSIRRLEIVRRATDTEIDYAEVFNV